MSTGSVQSSPRSRSSSTGSWVEVSTPKQEPSSLDSKSHLFLQEPLYWSLTDSSSHSPRSKFSDFSSSPGSCSSLDSATKEEMTNIFIKNAFNTPSPSPKSSRSESPIPPNPNSLPPFSLPKDDIKPPLKKTLQLTTTQILILTPIVIGVEVTKFSYNSVRSVTSYLTRGLL